MDAMGRKPRGLAERRRASLMAFGTGSLLPSPVSTTVPNTPQSPVAFLGKWFRRRSNSADLSSSIRAFHKLTRKPFLVKVTARMPDGRVKWLVGESGQKIGELLAGVAMDYKLSSYKVHLASTRALLNLDADTSLLQGEQITIDEDEGEHLDPRIAADPRLRVVYNLLKTEKHHQECIRSIFDVYAEPLRKFSSLSTEDHRVLFFGLEPILSISTTLCIKLEDAILTWDPGTTRIGNLFSKQFWHHYEEYYFGYTALRSLLRDKRENDEEFVQFCQLRRGAARHSLESLLLLPVKRIPEYDDYLSNLLPQTDESHPDYDDLNKAAAKVKNMVKEREEELMAVENDHKVESVQERFPNDNLQLQEKEKKGKGRRRSGSGAVWLRTLSKKHHSTGGESKANASPLAVPPDPANTSRTISGQKIDRRYVLEGPVQLTAGLQTHDRYLFLFNDLLLVAKQRSSTTFKLKHRVRVCEMWTSESCMDEVSEATRTEGKSFVIGWPTTNFVANFASPEMKDLWLERIKEQVQNEKEKEQPKTVILKIINKDMENLGAATKRLLISNYEEAEELVKKCIDEFRIQGGDTKDYQLWVVSGKEDSPYPLIGHEHPYSIWMSHLRDERKDGSMERDEVVLPVEMDMNDNSVQCQFILRETKKVHKKISIEEAVKIKKKSKSPLINFFRKSKHNNSAAGPSGKLFGYNLSDICENDEVPKQIMVLMQQLFMCGPYTHGIFRKSANHKRCQEIRNQMDNGEDISFDDLPVTAACSVLKDFMRSMPDCVMISDMYDQWVDTIPLTDGQTRIQKTRQLFERLPKCNRIFLEHFMCILFYIDKFSHENSMNAFNLGICASQNMLWPNPGLGAGIQTEAVERVPLIIQFMIENCIPIFGEDCIHLFGDPIQGKPRQDSSTDSDSIQSMLSAPGHNGTKVWDDSSVDSLEHGLIDSSPQLVKSPTNLSRDSGLTLSDTQLYDENESLASSNGMAAPIPSRKQSITRSTSQFDTPKASADPGQLSRSYDCTIDSLHHQQQAPVPPPRKSRHKKGSGPGEYSDTRSHVQRRPAMRHPALPPAQDLRKHMGHSQSSSGVSDGSLGSLDESSEMDMHDSMHMYGDDIGVLRKSASGAKLFVHEDPAMRPRMHYTENRRSAPPQVQEMDKYQKSLVHHDSLKRKSERRSTSLDADVTSQSWSDLERLGGDSPTMYGGVAQPIPENQPLVNYSSSYNNISSIPKPAAQRPVFSVTPPESPDTRDSEEFMRNNYTFVVPVSAPATSTPEKTGNYKFVVTPKTTDSRSQLRPKSLSMGGLKGSPVSRSMDSESPHHTPEPMDYSPTASSPLQSVHQGKSEDSRVKSRPLLRMGAVDMDISDGPKSPPQQPGGDGEPVQLRQKRNRYGMTATGADIFPGRLKTMYRHSLDEETIMKAMQKGGIGPGLAAFAQQAEPSRQAAMSSHVDTSPVVCQRSGSLSASMAANVERFRQARDMENSDSSSSVSDQQRTKQQQDSERSRPSQPPSYQEALHRKTMIKSGVATPTLYQHSEKDIIEQSQKGAKARRLYEESLKKYNQESIPTSPMEHSGSPRSMSRESTPSSRHQSPAPSVNSARSQSSPSRSSPSPKQLPSYEQACQRAEIIREHHQKAANPPSYQSHMRDTHSQSPASEIERSSSGQSRHPSNASSNSSREGTPSKGNLSRESSTSGSGRSKRKRDRGSSRSRERRIVHRLSDTRIHSNTARSSTNLCRSKSDSSEHLHRITKFHGKGGEDKENVSVEDLSKAHASRDMSRALTPEKNSNNVPSKNFRNLTPDRPGEEDRVSRKEERHIKQSSPVNPLIANIKLQRTQSDERPRELRNRRRSVPASMKNKDWHKELADTYSDLFYQPLPGDEEQQQVPPKQQVVYSYRGPRASEPEADKPRRKGWQRPVHPSKDLVVSQPRQGVESPEKTIVLDTRFRSSSDGLSRYESQSKPSENKQVKLESRDSTTTKREVVNATPQQEQASQQQTGEAEPQGINWSVKKLMNLYDDKKEKGQHKNTGPFYQPNSQPPSSKQRGQSPYRQSPRSTPDRRTPRERTNPRAEEAYV